MADEERNETTEQVAPDAAQSGAGAAEPTPDASAPAANATTRRQAREAAQATERSSRPSLSPAQRQAEREENRRAKAVARSRRRAQERERARARRTEVPPTPPAGPPSPGSPKVRLGRVVSDKPDKTITVRIESARRHRRYEKIVRSSATLHAHDERNDASEGDLVRVVESRPTSRTKRWRLVEILERAQ